MKILVLAPARWAPRPLLDTFTAAARRFGFEVEIAPQNDLRDHQLAGLDADRAQAFSQGLARTDVDVIWCARGGYGAGRLLPSIVPRTEARPLIVVGYSDITALHMADLGRSVTAIHAAMPVDLKAPEKLDNLDAAFALCRALIGGEATPRRDFALSSVRPGQAQGPVAAANLSVLVHGLGTPYVRNLDGAILCLEDVGEYLYAVDRMFLQLKLSGALDRVAGLVLGDFSDTQDNDPAWGYTVEQIAARYYAGPIATGLPIGHSRHNQPMVLGAAGRLVCDAEGATLSVQDRLSQ